MAENHLLERIAESLEKIAEHGINPPVVNNATVVQQEPNTITYAMLLGVTQGFAFSLREILDDPRLNAMDRAKRLRKQVTIAEQMAREYNEKLEELKQQQKIEEQSGND